MGHMDVPKALELCGGAARRPALASLGIDDASLRRALRGGVLQPERGLYALATAPSELVALVQGFTALRYYYTDVVYTPTEMLAQVQTVLARRR